MPLALVATVCAGLFAGAAIYITLVEHPARLSCGTALAVREFGPSYLRATFMQAPLAFFGAFAALDAWWQSRDAQFVVGGLLLGAVVPFTLLVIAPTNRHLTSPALDPESEEALRLLHRWGRLHAVRTVLSAAAFVVLLLNVAAD
jgi:uncharacterized membrane protein